MADSSSSYLLVVAIDFGTTYSGYAFQFKHEYNATDPIQITAPQCWNDGKKHIVSMKTPTSILLKEDKSIDSFGYEAEKKYTDICLDGEQDEWYFFRRFKMKLQEGEGLCKTSELLDETGKKGLPAIDIFAKSITCLKSKLLIDLDKRNTGALGADDMLFVITVPAIWDEKSKQFMKEAAIKSGIKETNVMVALEPEAASLYCQYLPVGKFVTGGGHAKCSLSTAGTVYMIVDLGGGTADITVHEKLENGELKEVHSACGGPWGGIMVDSYFIQALSSIVKPLAFSEFMYQHTGDYMDMMMEFEAAKRNVNQSTDKHINLKVPSCLNDVTEKHIGKLLSEAIDESEHRGKIKFAHFKLSDLQFASFLKSNLEKFQNVCKHLTSVSGSDGTFGNDLSMVVGDKLRISPELSKSFFQKVAKNITQELDSCIQEVESKGKKISLILMVGGFSESPYIQDVVKDRYASKDMKVVIPEEAGLSVLKGAVIFGRQPATICSRVLRYTYGAEIMPKFDPKQYDSSKKTVDGTRAKNVFMPFVTKGTEMKLGDKVVKTYNTVKPNQDSIVLKIFCADRPCKYTTDKGCRFVGTLKLSLTKPSTELQDLNVVYEFGGTEILVNGKEVLTGSVCRTTFKMLD